MSPRILKQPELGKKISELRKIKGLTQEELVAKCNLSVRTLQRIESGEVTPRSYTVKQILVALNGADDDSLRQIYVNYKKTPGQFLYKFFDLFNLKTNTMKKISILTVMFLAIFLGIYAITGNLKAQINNDQQKPVSEEIIKDEEPAREMVFRNFCCGSCFTEGDLSIGRDVKFTINGVKVKAPLIAINKKTREINMGAIKGLLMEHRVELYIAKDFIIDDLLNYSADNIEKTDSTIFLKGNARIFEEIEEGEEESDGYIEADEILITLK